MGTCQLNAGGTRSYPGGSRNTPNRFVLHKTEINSGLMGHLARMQTLLTLPDSLAGKQLDTDEMIY